MKDKFDDAPSHKAKAERPIYQYEDKVEDEAVRVPSLGEQAKKTQPIKRRGKVQIKAGQPANLPAHYYNEEGEVDLRQVTGKEAYNFFLAQGIKLPIFQR